MPLSSMMETIKIHQQSGKSFKAFIGLDGFVDELLNVVDIRQNADNFSKIKTLAAYGDRISRAAGLSTNVELVSIVRKLGGNGPIFANALAEQGLDVTYVGALGETSIHPVFEPMGEKCKLFPISDPGLSFNLEFDDGKLIMVKQDPLNKITWDVVKEKVGLEEIISLVGADDLDLFGLENWALIPNMNDVFNGILDEVLPLIDPKGKLAFFDLCDSEKRLDEDLVEAIGLIKRFSSHFRVVLGVNLKEAAQVATALGIEGLMPSGGTIEDIDLEEITVTIGKLLGIHCFVVHALRDAGAYAEGKYHYASGFYTPTPKLTTGAGDNFNAGLCLGLLMELSYNEALLLGTASSGFYVREAKSADLSGLIDILETRKEITNEL